METAEEFAKSLADNCEDGGPYDAYWNPVLAIPLIRARDAEQRKAGALAALGEVKRCLDLGMPYEVLALRKLSEAIESGEWKP